MSEKNQNENINSSESSSQTASEALRAAFLELSNSALNIEKEIEQQTNILSAEEKPSLEEEVLVEEKKQKKEKKPKEKKFFKFAKKSESKKSEPVAEENQNTVMEESSASADENEIVPEEKIVEPESSVQDEKDSSIEDVAEVTEKIEEPKSQKKEKKQKPVKEKKIKTGPNYWERLYAPEEKSGKISTGLWKTVMARELHSYFTSPIAYIVTALFLVSSGFLFFSTFFLGDRAELRSFFYRLPVLFSFFIPALTMRIFAEEKKSGSLETLMTLPVTTFDVVLGKYLATLISSLAMLVPTLSYVIACNMFGHPDGGPIWGGYIGAIFLAAAFTAVGLFSSSVTKNQILAFFMALAICIFSTFVGSFIVLLPSFLATLFTFISASSHFDSISRGILDSRDLIYFISVTALFVALTVRRLNKSRRD